MLDAIVRTLWRLAVSRRRLLDWVTAEQASRAPEMSVGAYYRWMAPSVVVAALALVVGFTTAPLTGLVALPFALAWVCRASARLRRRAAPTSHSRAASSLDEDDALGLRLIARRTWLFFERFVTAEENWLPPDNYQEPPRGRDRPPDVADQYRPLPALGRVAPATSAGSASTTWSSGSTRRSAR